MHTRPLACLPNAKGAMLGELGHFSAKMGKEESWDSIAAEAARTVPGRENGGNCDIKNLSTGCNARRRRSNPGLAGGGPTACDPGPATQGLRPRAWTQGLRPLQCEPRLPASDRSTFPCSCRAPTSRWET